MTVSNIPAQLSTALARIALVLRQQDISFTFGTVDNRLWVESDYWEDYPQVAWYDLSVEPAEVMRDFGLAN